jgi:hypothetical protein
MFRRDLYKLEPEEEKRPFKYDDGTPHMIIQRKCHHPPSNTPRQQCDGKVVTSYTDKCAIVDPCARILLGSPPFLDVFAIKVKRERCSGCTTHLVNLNGCPCAVTSGKRGTIWQGWETLISCGGGLKMCEMLQNSNVNKALDIELFKTGQNL